MSLNSEQRGAPASLCWKEKDAAGQDPKGLREHASEWGGGSDKLGDWLVAMWGGHGGDWRGTL